MVCFSYMGTKRVPFFSWINSTENSWRMWCLNPPFCSHTEILWHELSDVSSWNQAVPECQHWSQTRCTWDRSLEQGSSSSGMFHLSLLHLCCADVRDSSELAVLYLLSGVSEPPHCAGWFRQLLSHTQLPVTTARLLPALLLCLQGSWEFLPIVVCRAAIPSAAPLVWTRLCGAFTATQNRMAESLKISQSNQRWF